MGVAVILSGPVMQILRDGSMGRQLFQPISIILPQTAFVIINKDSGCDVHGID